MKALITTLLAALVILLFALFWMINDLRTQNQRLQAQVESLSSQVSSLRVDNRYLSETMEEIEGTVADIRAEQEQER